MHLHKVTVRNFRLLADADLVLETPTTLIVGRNNSGKTSLSEAIRRFLADQNPRFQIEDFSNTSYDRFCDALAAKNVPGALTMRSAPSFRASNYDSCSATTPTQPDLGALSDFIVDLDPDCNEALVVARYAAARWRHRFAVRRSTGRQLSPTDDRIAFFQELRQRVPATLFAASIWAEDPNDDANRKADDRNRAPLAPENRFRECSAWTRR